MYQLTSDAERDLDKIADYSIENFGLAQAETYLLGLRECFEILDEHPALGRDYSHIKTSCRRHEYVSHSVYYTSTDTGVLILRVLHQSMGPGRHIT
ncbi:MAG: type II toxin-antitoxin system RelE/ParE family toxin [Candidatus Tectomicrobia bacterium]|nr:type II toxin-antitoxin system RelE/ParE family toxin [Candidatus Tectomicrobia bacterium]